MTLDLNPRPYIYMIYEQRYEQREIKASQIFCVDKQLWHPLKEEAIRISFTVHHHCSQICKIPK